MIHSEKMHKWCGQYVSRFSEHANKEELNDVVKLTDAFLTFTFTELEKELAETLIKKNPNFKEMMKKFDLEINID